MFVLEVSYGCPDEKDPLNGVFQMDQSIALKKYGHKVVFVAIDFRSIRKWRKWGINEYEIDGMPIVAFNFPFGPLFPNLRRKLAKLAFDRVFRLVTIHYGIPDLVHVHFGDMATCVDETCKRNGVPFVLTEHSSSINQEYIPERELKPLRKAYQDASAVIAVSSVLSKRINQFFNVHSIVIPNIIDFSVFTSKKQAHPSFQFVSAGNIKKEKGFDILVSAFQIMREKGFDVRLLIMGDGPEKTSLETMVRNAKMSDYVSFYGKYTREDFAFELTKSDVFVLPSRGETFGVVYVEAMASGVPVIATACGGPEDFVEEGNGLLVSVDDISGLCDAMVYMRQNISQYDRDSIIGKVKRRFNDETVALMISNVFNSVRDCYNEPS